jgi:outer membrane protein OmpA-like peptidoglycan-associated protein
MQLEECSMRSNIRCAAATACSVSAALVLLGGCQSMSERERGTAIGAGGGAVAGAVIGSSTGHSAGKGAVIGGALGAVAGNLWSKRMEDKRKEMQAATAGSGVEVQRTQDNQLKVSVPADVSFDSGRADIKPEMRPVLDKLTTNLDPKVNMTVVGHTDSTGSDAINDALSIERAHAVRNYLSVRGIDAERIAVQGRGSREPVASNASDSGRAQNRRVEIFLAERSA